MKIIGMKSKIALIAAVVIVIAGIILLSVCKLPVSSIDVTGLPVIIDESFDRPAEVNTNLTLEKGTFHDGKYIIPRDGGGIKLKYPGNKDLVLVAKVSVKADPNSNSWIDGVNPAEGSIIFDGVDFYINLESKNTRIGVSYHLPMKPHSDGFFERIEAKEPGHIFEMKIIRQNVRGINKFTYFVDGIRVGSIREEKIDAPDGIYIYPFFGILTVDHLTLYELPR